MKKILLTPYSGYVLLAKTKDEFYRLYTKHAGRKCELTVGAGMTSRTRLKHGHVFIIYAVDIPSLAHEFCHVLLDLFDYIEERPNAGNGEPFAYMMSYLMKEARK